MGYRHGAHTVFEIHLHLVWVTEYRKPVMRGEVGVRVRELIRQVCREQEVEILKGHVSKDDVHLFVSIPPHVTISRLVHEEDAAFRVEGERDAGEGEKGS